MAPSEPRHISPSFFYLLTVPLATLSASGQCVVLLDFCVTMKGGWARQCENSSHCCFRMPQCAMATCDFNPPQSSPRCTRIRFYGRAILERWSYNQNKETACSKRLASSKNTDLKTGLHSSRADISCGSRVTSVHGIMKTISTQGSCNK